MTARIDFIRRPAPPAVGRGLLAIGVLATAATIWVDQRWRIEREARAQQRAAVAIEAERAHQASLRKAPPTLDEVRIQRISPQLREPWLPTLRLVEHVTTAPVYLLGLSIDPSAATVRLDGEASSFDDVLGYMRDLNQNGLLGPSQLRSHEALTDAGGRPAVRFSIVTRWSMP